MLNVTKIAPGVHYVGVNDRTTSLFENLWPLPQGVSYNSYIVCGSRKTALIDAVEISEIASLLANISRLGIDKIDYLVVNHMEPDHSGSIPEVVRAFPGIKLVGNKQTLGMVRGFYHLDDPALFHEVADCDTIDLGGKTLGFYLTPMVHWPETMMTYLEEDRLLFSGDGFGTFGTLDGGVTDREMDTDRYIPEMYRYYSCIVGKYGKFVQKALQKLSTLQIQTICSTHGPVWQERLSEVVGIYDRLSRYEPEDGATIVYGSMYGHTASMADSIARAITARGVRNIRIHDASKSPMADMITDAFRYRILIVGSPTYSMTLFPPVAAFMTAIAVRELKNRVFASFSSYTWAPVVEKEMQKHLDAMALTSVGHVTMKQDGDADTPTKLDDLAQRIMQACCR